MTEQRLSKHELLLLSNCIGETLEVIDDSELPTRTGADRDELTTLRATIRALAETIGERD